jgi:hypothetical protein
MFALLLHPPAQDPDLAAQELAQMLGGTPYDHKAPLLRGLPYLTGWHTDAQVVMARALELRGAGLPAWAVARAALERTPEVRTAKTVAWDADGLQLGFRDVNGLAQETLPWAEIALALPCRSDSAQEVITATTTKKTNMAAMAMGMPLSSKKTTTERDIESASRFFALLWLQARGELVRIDAENSDWRGLGAEMRHGALGNFQALLDVLRARAPAAWDPRLERAGGKVAATTLPLQQSTAGTGSKTIVATKTRAWDSESGVMQAARLMILAKMLAARS